MNQAAASIYLYLAIFVVISVVIKLLFNKSFRNRSKKVYSYKLKLFLLSKPEHELFDLLVQNFGDKFHIFPQVHLSSIFDHKIKGQNWWGAFSHINRKSIDFLFCDKAYIKPILGIELDDSSHNRLDRIERDKEVVSIFQTSGLPLLRFENHGKFDHQEIIGKINSIAGK